jgi:hypothetical protein
LHGKKIEEKKESKTPVPGDADTKIRDDAEKQLMDEAKALVENLSPDEIKKICGISEGAGPFLQCAFVALQRLSREGLSALDKETGLSKLGNPKPRTSVREALQDALNFLTIIEPTKLAEQYKDEKEKAQSVLDFLNNHSKTLGIEITV